MSDFYKPYAERTPDTQYRVLLKKIRDEGEDMPSQQDEDARMIFGHQMRFPLANGFPIIGERDLVSPGKTVGSQFKMALAEICAFINGARTQEELERFGVAWWKSWVTKEKCEKRGLKEGDLGPGSYGAAFHDFPTAEGKPFNQVAAIVQQIKERPHLRTHRIVNWIPQYQFRMEGFEQKVVVCPCHGDMHFRVNVVTKTISLHHVQRSADAPVGLVFNFIQYAAMLMMMAQVTGYTPKDLVYTTSDTHIFLKQLPEVEKLLATEPQKFPTVRLDPSVTDIFAFRPEHFTVTDYEPRLERMRIWTPV